MKKMQMKYEFPDPAKVKARPEDIHDMLQHAAAYDKAQCMGILRAIIHEVYDPTKAIDEFTLGLLADEIHRYALANEALNNEPLVEPAINGTRMVNPNFKIRDVAVGRILTLREKLGMSQPPSKPVTIKHKVEKLLSGPDLS